MFQPSVYSTPSVDGEYGAWALFKRRRRDRLKRRAERKEDRAKKLAAKGKKDKAARLRAKSRKLRGKSKDLAKKLQAKGKTTTLTRRTSRPHKEILLEINKKRQQRGLTPLTSLKQVKKGAAGVPAPELEAAQAEEEADLLEAQAAAEEAEANQLEMEAGGDEYEDDEGSEDEYEDDEYENEAEAEGPDLLVPGIAAAAVLAGIGMFFYFRKQNAPAPAAG